jgi:hypothetical protein
MIQCTSCGADNRNGVSASVRAAQDAPFPPKR